MSTLDGALLILALDAAAQIVLREVARRRRQRAAADEWNAGLHWPEGRR